MSRPFWTLGSTVPVGTWNYYDSLGKLIRREIYNHHKIKGWLKIIKYTEKDNIEEKIVGYDSHFGELDTVWKWSLKKKDGEIVNLLNRKKYLQLGVFFD